jgi:hypothetical protein
VRPRSIPLGWRLKLRIASSASSPCPCRPRSGDLASLARQERPPNAEGADRSAAGRTSLGKAKDHKDVKGTVKELRSGSVQSGLKRDGWSGDGWSGDGLTLHPFPVIMRPFDEAGDGAELAKASG